MVILIEISGERGDLCLRRRKPLEVKPLAKAGRRDFSLQDANRPTTAHDWAVVLGQALQRLVAQIKSIEACILALKPRHHPEALRIVVKPTEGCGCRRQSSLARVAKGRVAQIVSQGERLGQILVEPKHAGHSAGDLRHLQTMREARSIVVPLMEYEHLRLVGEASEGGGVHDAVPVALKGCTHGTSRL